MHLYNEIILKKLSKAQSITKKSIMLVYIEGIRRLPQYTRQLQDFCMTDRSVSALNA